jgi:glycogen debranching enzyme
MDAMVGDKPVTPRTGKAVDINALWYNALRIYSELLLQFDDINEAERIKKIAGTVRKRFVEVFYNEKTGYLYDCVDGDYYDISLRPNQIFAISLPFPLITGDKAKQILKIISEKLFTPYGLRSLSPEDPNYKPSYKKAQIPRGEAFHQGMAWPWLLGPFITALARLYGDAGRQKAMKIIQTFKTPIITGGIGTIPEIFDGDKPHSQEGCIAQAWSVAEILRAYIEDIKGFKPNKNGLS